MDDIDGDAGGRKWVPRAEPNAMHTADEELQTYPAFPCYRAMPQTLMLDHVSPATRLLEKRRQMFEVQEALEAQKQDFNRKEEVFKRREEALKLKDLELQESLIRFSKFLQENDSKRARAEKKAADEIKARLQKEKEIEQLTEVLEELKTEKERILEVLEKNMRWGGVGARGYGRCRRMGAGGEGGVRTNVLGAVLPPLTYTLTRTRSLCMRLHSVVAGHGGKVAGTGWTRAHLHSTYGPPYQRRSRAVVNVHHWPLLSR